MKKWLAAMLVMVFLSADAMAQSPTNPPTGSVWTYRDLSSGPGWVMPDSVNILQYGAVADDATDLGAAMQAAYNAVAPSGLCVRIPRGIYRITTPVMFGPGGPPPCFFGDGWNEAAGSEDVKLGTWIHITDTSLIPFTIRNVIGLGGMPGFSNMAFWHDQPPDAPGWAPNPYQYIFDLRDNGGRIDFDNLYFWNTTHCIHYHSTARSHIRVSGMPVGTCLLFEHVGDVIFLDKVDFVHLWKMGSNSNITAYNQANTDPVVFKRVDSPFIGNYFTIGYRSGIRFDSSTVDGGYPAGATTGAQITNLQLDACKYCIYITGNATQLQIANVRTASQTYANAPIPGGSGYYDTSDNSVVSIGNFDCYYAGANCLTLTGHSEVQIANSLLWSYNWDNSNAAGFNAGLYGVIKSANPPNILNQQNGAIVLPHNPVGGTYVMPGVTQNWTPVLSTTNSNGTFTYTYRTGSFWYDGAKLTVNFKMQVAVSGSPTGSVEIGGLPLSGYNLGPNTDTPCVIGLKVGVTLTSGYTTMGGLVTGAGSTKIQLVENAPAADTLTLPASTLSPTVYLQGSCIMQTGL